jgi:TRAP transporter TAXI family solute receptor
MGDDVKFIDVTPVLAGMQEINPVYEETTIPADTYELDADVPTFSVPNLLMVRNDMPENLACALTTLMVEQKDQLVQVHPAAAEISAENAAKTDPVPLHPGSERALESLSE